MVGCETAKRCCLGAGTNFTAGRRLGDRFCGHEFFLVDMVCEGALELTFNRILRKVGSSQGNVTVLDRLYRADVDIPSLHALLDGLPHAQP